MIVDSLDRAALDSDGEYFPLLTRVETPENEYNRTARIIRAYTSGNYEDYLRSHGIYKPICIY